MKHAHGVTPAAPLVAFTHRGGRHRTAPLRARLRALSLDRQLASGVEPWRSPVHAARARQLTGERTRRMLARSLEQLIERAEDPPRVHRGAAIQPSRARVAEARPLMLTLASRLRGIGPVAPRGIAALKNLLTDGAGPVYTHGDPETLRRRLAAIDRWLDVPD